MLKQAGLGVAVAFVGAISASQPAHASGIENYSDKANFLYTILQRVPDFSRKFSDPLIRFVSKQNPETRELLETFNRNNLGVNPNFKDSNMPAIIYGKSLSAYINDGCLELEKVIQEEGTTISLQIGDCNLEDGFGGLKGEYVRVLNVNGTGFDTSPRADLSKSDFSNGLDSKIQRAHTKMFNFAYGLGIIIDKYFKGMEKVYAEAVEKIRDRAKGYFNFVSDSARESLLSDGILLKNVAKEVSPGNRTFTGVYVDSLSNSIHLKAEGIIEDRECKTPESITVFKSIPLNPGAAGVQYKITGNRVSLSSIKVEDRSFFPGSIGFLPDTEDKIFEIPEESVDALENILQRDVAPLMALASRDCRTVQTFSKKHERMLEDALEGYVPKNAISPAAEFEKI